MLFAFGWWLVAVVGFGSIVFLINKEGSPTGVTSIRPSYGLGPNGVPPSLLDFVDVAPVFISSGLELLDGMNVSVALVDPLNGSVEAVAIVGGYFETTVGLLTLVEGGDVLFLFTGARKGPALVPRGGPRIAGFADPQIGY